MEVSKIVMKAYELAKQAQKNAYAPYSHFEVGAAIKIKDCDEIITGCNLENASYGATVCAERGAIQSSMVKLGRVEFEFLVVVSNSSPAIGPCALCLQVISEFAKPDLPIYFANQKEIQSKNYFGDLLPKPFAEIPKIMK